MGATREEIATTVMKTTADYQRSERQLGELQSLSQVSSNREVSRPR